jgi:hypothetical protein
VKEYSIKIDKLFDTAAKSKKKLSKEEERQKGSCRILKPQVLMCPKITCTPLTTVQSERWVVSPVMAAVALLRNSKFKISPRSYRPPSAQLNFYSNIFILSELKNCSKLKSAQAGRFANFAR